MPVLLMARGDQEARDLLIKAIEARYGTRPPVIESMRIDFNGRTRAKVGPLTTWVPVEVTAQFRLPDALRWDFNAKPVGVSIRRGVESYDGTTFRSLRGSGEPDIIEDAATIEAAQKRLWAFAALLLTPLGDHFVELTSVGELAFSAKNRQLDTAVEIHLKPNHWIDQVTVMSPNPDNGKVQQFSLTVEQELAQFDDLLLPKKITAIWDNDPWFEVEPSEAKNNPDISDAVFSLEADAETQ